MAEDEVTGEKQYDILNYNNAIFKSFSGSRVREISLGLHVGGSSGKDKNVRAMGIEPNAFPYS
jgi:hypothetical protein